MGRGWGHENKLEAITRMDASEAEGHSSKGPD